VCDGAEFLRAIRCEARPLPCCEEGESLPLGPPTARAQSEGASKKGVSNGPRCDGVEAARAAWKETLTIARCGLTRGSRQIPPGEARKESVVPVE